MKDIILFSFKIYNISLSFIIKLKLFFIIKYNLLNSSLLL